MWYKLTWMYIWSQKVRPSEWQPWANTVAYYPLSVDFNDYSWNNRNLTNNGLSIWSSWANQDVCILDWNYASITDTNIMWSIFTTSFRYKYTSGGSTAMDVISRWEDNWLNSNFIRIGLRSDINDGLQVGIGSDTDSWMANGFNITNSWMLSTDWHNVIITFDWLTVSVYIDGVLKTTHNITWTYTPLNAPTKIGTGYAYFPCYWAISEIIFEDNVRTSQEITGYYNQTKANYWI